MILNEIWDSRSLIQLFVISDIKKRYRNTVLGFFWSLIEPLLLLTVLFLVFSYLMKSPIENYPLYLLSGIVMWRMFSNGTNMGLQSFHQKSPILKRIYLKKELLPISSSLTALVIGIFEFSVFFIFIAIMQFIPPVTIFLLVPIFLLEFILILGISFFLSVTNVFLKDVQHIWSVVLTAGFFASPILYQIDSLPENIRTILYINPMTPILDMAHGVVLYGVLPVLSDLLFSIFYTMGILIFGILIFNKLKNKAIEEL